MDDIDRLIRDANPGRSRQDMPLTPRAEDDLRRILERRPGDEAATPRLGQRPPRRMHGPRRGTGPSAAASRPRRRTGRGSRVRRRSRASLLTIGSLASLVLVAIVVFGFAFSAPTPAVASTPPLLDITPVAGGPAELLEEAAQMRLETKTTSPDDTASPDATEQSIRMHQWALAVTEGENGEITYAEVVPESRKTTFTADGRVTTRVVAGEPYPGESPEGLPAPGTLIWEDEISAEEFFEGIAGEPPTDAASMGEYLAPWTFEETPTLGGYFGAITGVLLSRTLTAEQEAAILQFLAAQDGIRVDGSVTDRLGRTGIVFRASDRTPGEYEDLLIVSPESGKILAAETIYIGSSRDYLASPSVVEYFAWER